ncbi:MAG: hypothetical protein H6736_25025 [Alphaproteobacteria bacterium]|nr:hypothetical protein [Alphaproteobacteria bacterium]
MIWKDLRAFLKASWPRVASHDVMSVLQAGARWDEPLPEPLAELAALAPVEVATALMVPVASAMHDRKPWDRIEVLGALDALIRAGGDPSAILPDVIGALDVERTREAAGGVLHRAALHGNPIHTALSALAPYAGSRHGGLRDAHTLAALQAAGQGDAVERVGAVIRGLAPYGDLQGAIGLVEHQLLASDTRAVDEARVVLDGLLEAVPDRGAAWLAVVPVLCTQLRSAEPSWRREAAQAAGKARHVLAGPAPGGRLEPLVEALADCLAHSDDGVAGLAASALGALVATGGSLASVRARVDAALLDPREAVRSAVSPALSAWLVAAGLEETLPPGRSHRRIWALTDTPVEGPVVCPHCGDPDAAVIHRYHHRRQFGEDNLVETCCPACRVYSVETYGYDH